MNKFILVMLLTTSFFSNASEVAKTHEKQTPSFKKEQISFFDNNNNYIHCVSNKEDSSMDCKNQNEETVICSNSDQSGFTCSSN